MPHKCGIDYAVGSFSVICQIIVILPIKVYNIKAIAHAPGHFARSLSTILYLKNKVKSISKKRKKKTVERDSIVYISLKSASLYR